MTKVAVKPMQVARVPCAGSVQDKPPDSHHSRRRSAFILCAVLACDGAALRARYRGANGRGGGEDFVELALAKLSRDEVVSSGAARVGLLADNLGGVRKFDPGADTCDYGSLVHFFFTRITLATAAVKPVQVAQVSCAESVHDRPPDLHQPRRQSAFVLHAALACDGVALRARCGDATGGSEVFVDLVLVELPSDDAVNSGAARVGFPLRSSRKDRQRQ